MQQHFAIESKSIYFKSLIMQHVVPGPTLYIPPWSWAEEPTIPVSSSFLIRSASLFCNCDRDRRVGFFLFLAFFTWAYLLKRIWHHSYLLLYLFIYHSLTSHTQLNNFKISLLLVHQWIRCLVFKLCRPPPLSAGLRWLSAESLCSSSDNTLRINTRNLPASLFHLVLLLSLSLPLYNIIQVAYW